MINVKQIWKEITKKLQRIYTLREAENIAYLLLEDLFEVDRLAIFSEEDRILDEKKLNKAIERLLLHEPIQYVTGVADFYGRKFKIANGVFIPRPETEELIDLIIQENIVKKPKILDVGMGSGCIAISLVLEMGGIIFGTDVSDEALHIADWNATKMGAKVFLSKHDILQNKLFEHDLDILVSNPPYIPIKEQARIRDNVLKYEPSLALFVPDNDPIIFYKTIALEGVIALKNGGNLYFEIHESFGKKIHDYLIQLGYVDVLIHQDMQGKDRIVSAKNSIKM